MLRAEVVGLRVGSCHTAINLIRAESQLMGLRHLSLDFVQHLLHPPQLEQAHASKWGLSESYRFREVPPSNPFSQALGSPGV